MGRYLITKRAKESLREIKRHSIEQFGSPVAKKYFEDLTKGFNIIADFKGVPANRPELTGNACLTLYPLREHYVVYTVSGPYAVILDVVLQSRDVSRYLQRYSGLFRRELADFKLPLKLKDKPNKSSKKP